ncbi:hypothetical protein OVA13_04340 [Pseudoxanthomonas sp. SL93]|uniref:hypothetical protein n=1 Tax=Pseudoxanthomonas sp. SL93 TaxID=2995142 RepID=UPI0022722464|nr:hypothetical protein [Pseudoxanthomonas sp. SL93]WAC64017.1 hypothetical protein OVA13_04340 [Pseudoxanthomonas sp. SL93]
MEKNILVVDHASCATHQIQLYFEGKHVSSATAFLYRHGGKRFLITNWHNFSGKNAETGECISETAAIPDEFRIVFRTDNTFSNLRGIAFDLYKDADRTQPEWYEHPIHGSKVDVVAVPFEDAIADAAVEAPAINDDAELRDLDLRASDDAFVIGFPFVDAGRHVFPVWKRATIASEPAVDVNSLPLTYIDTATRPGFSGAPVLMRRIGVHFAYPPKLTGTEVIGEVRSLAGVYSGRTGDLRDIGGQIGMMWKKTAIDQIIEAEKFGNSPHWPTDSS